MYELVLLLLVIAFLMITAGLIMISLSRSREGRSLRGGGVIVIGPIPIVIGTDQEVAKELMLLAIVLMVVSVLIFLTLLRAMG